ncbi:MAG: RNA methyltransferase [Bacteroidota bacterium]
MPCVLTYNQKCGLYHYLTEFITENRKQRFEEVVAFRTRFITVVLEDIYQPHNASAVLRTCDCFGIQDVHIIENKNKYRVNPDVALGSSNWLTLHKYNKKDNNTSDCIKILKKEGYKVIATTPHENYCNINELNLSHKTALLFGTEMKGLSEQAIQQADGYVKIPMYGFTESFNISVSAAIALFSLTERLRKSNTSWQLDKNEILNIKTDWVKNSLKNADEIEKKYFEKIKTKKAEQKL